MPPHQRRTVGLVNAGVARILHALVACLALAAVVWQLVLVIEGASVLDETARPDLGTRLIRFISYFTVLSNILVLWVAAVLARDPWHDGTRWRIVRLAAVSAIAVTGAVHWFFLRPILDLSGGSYAVDKLLHVVVPLVAVVVWVLAGPRGQATPTHVLPSLLYPALWGAYTMIRGQFGRWWPYPFVDVDALGWGRVLVNLVAVGALFAGVGGLFVVADRWLRGRPRPADEGQ